MKPRLHGCSLFRPLVTSVLCVMALTSPSRASASGQADPAIPGSETSSRSVEAGAVPQPDGPPAVQRAADFTAKDMKGRPVHLVELLEKGPVFLHFWTTFCPSCQKGMAELYRIYDKYRDQGFQVLAIAQDDVRTAQKVKLVVENKKYKMPVITDTKREIGALYKVRQYPTGYLIASDGSVVRYTQGYLPGDEKALEEDVRKLLRLEANP